MCDKVTELIAELSSPDEETRRFAIEDLGELGDVRAVRPLVDMLSDRRTAVREAAVDALKAIGGKPTAMALLPHLRHSEAAVRNAASEILQSIGDEAVPHLQKLLQDDDKDVRKFAVDILAVIGSPQTEAAFIEALNDRDVNVAAAAAEALGKVGSHQAVSPLVRSLKASSWTRCSVAKSLGQIGGREAVQALTELTCDEDPMVVFTAVEALGATRCPEAVGSLLEVLGHENQLIVQKAVASIEELESGLTPDAWEEIRQRMPVEKILRLLESSDQSLQCRAITMLGRLKAVEALQPLLRLLTDQRTLHDQDTRQLALKAIADIEPEDIGPFLEKLKDPRTSPESRCELIDVLGRLQREEAFEVVASFIDDQEMIVRRVVSRVLVRIDPHRCVQPLLKALRCSDKEVRLNAAQGLGIALAAAGAAAIHARSAVDGQEQGSQTTPLPYDVEGMEQVVRELGKLLDDLDPEVRRAGAGALAAIGTTQATTILLEKADSGALAGRVAAVWALGSVTSQPAVDQALAAALRDKKAELRIAALKGLLRRDQIRVGRTILGCLADPVPEVRQTAVKLLAKQKRGAWIVHLLQVFREDTDIQVLHDCALALGRLRPPGSEELLAKYLENDPHPMVALAALEALGQIGGTKARAVLEEMTLSDDPELATVAMEALQDLTPQPAACSG